MTITALDGINPINAIFNKVVIKNIQLELEDHLYVQSVRYAHQVIYMGNNKVILYSDKYVKLDSIKTFKKYSTLNKMKVQ